MELFQLEPDQPFIMKTNASDHAIGAVLEQEKDGKNVPVAFLVVSWEAANLTGLRGRRRLTQ